MEANHPRGAQFLLRDQMRMHDKFPLALSTNAEAAGESHLLSITNIQVPLGNVPKPTTPSSVRESAPRRLPTREMARTPRSTATSPRIKSRLADDQTSPDHSPGRSSRPLSMDTPMGLYEQKLPSMISKTPILDEDSQYILLSQHEHILEERTHQLTKIFQEKLESQYVMMQKKLEELVRKFRQQLVEAQNAGDQKLESLVQKYSDGRDAELKLQDSRNQLKEVKKVIEKHRKELQNLEQETARLKELQKIQEEARLVALRAQYAKETQDREQELSRLKDLLHGQADLLDRQQQFKTKQIKSAQETLSQLEELMEVDLTCSRCLGIFCNPVIIIPCGHTYCHKCVLDVNRPYCEECPETNNVGVIPNYALDLIALRYESRKMYMKNLTELLANLSEEIDHIRQEATQLVSTSDQDAKK